MKSILLVCFSVTFHFLAHSQCTNTFQWPVFPIAASGFNDTVIISTESFAGDYTIINTLEEEATYIFESSNSGDYITLRNLYDPSILIAHGTTPLTYTSSSIDILAVHFNLSVPTCGTDMTTRTTTIRCSSCPDTPPTIGVNTNTPQASLDIAGEIKVGNSGRAPQAGMIRWNAESEDFEGHNGTKWVSLTVSNQKDQWGKIPSTKMAPDQKIVANDGNTSDNFGQSVSISGKYAIVGAPLKNIGSNSDQGQAYIFEKLNSNWELVTTLIANDGDQLDQFGFSVAIDGDYAIVGAPTTFEFTSSAGAAYIFHREGDIWSQQSKLLSSDGEIGDQFGSAVDIDGEYCVVGSYLKNNGSFDEGAAYVYFRASTSWAEQSKLVAMNAGSGDQFGGSVSISANYIASGAFGDNINSNFNQGSVYIYGRTGSTWSQLANITADDGELSDAFGKAVSLSGNALLVGAPNHNSEANTGQGAAYIFRRFGSSWLQEFKMVANDGDSNDYFGGSVALSDDMAIIGSRNTDINLNIDQGSAYLFQDLDDTWEQLTKFCASDGSAGDNFGGAVDIGRDAAIVGSMNDDIGINASQGSAHIITKK